MQLPPPDVFVSDEAPAGIAASAYLRGQLVGRFLFSLGRWIPLVVDLNGGD